MDTGVEASLDGRVGDDDGDDVGWSVVELGVVDDDINDDIDAQHTPPMPPVFAFGSSTATHTPPDTPHWLAMPGTHRSASPYAASSAPHGYA